jgi:MFS family permease
VSRRLAVALVAMLSAAATGLYLMLAAKHLGYAGEMDYIEGVMMDHVARLVAGKPIYVKPSVDFISLAYMPGWTVAAAAVARVLGPGFLAGRLVSFAGSLVIGGLVLAILKRETRSWTIAIAGAGLYYMGYGAAGGGHYDVARPDSLMLALALGALYVLRFTEGTAGAVVSALMLVAAFFTKQHAVWFGLLTAVHVWFNERRRLVAFVVPWVLGCAGGYALLAVWLGPWFTFYTWNLPAHWSHVAPIRIEHYLGAGLLGMLGGLTVPALLSLMLPEAPWRGKSGLWMWLGLAGVGTGLLATLDPSAWKHVFIPSMVAMSVLGPLSIWRLMSAFGAASPVVRERAMTAACALLAVQFIPLIYNVHVERPHPHAARAHDALVDYIRGIPGHVIVVEHGYYTTLAGKGSGLQQIAIGDLERASGDALYRSDPHYLQKLFDPLRRGPGRPTLITDEALGDLDPLWASIAPGYKLTADLGDMTAPLATFGGHALAPRFVYSPIEPRPGADSVAVGAAVLPIEANAHP